MGLFWSKEEEEHRQFAIIRGPLFSYCRSETTNRGAICYYLQPVNDL